MGASRCVLRHARMSNGIVQVDLIRNNSIACGIIVSY